jgi:hypothetical protein
MLTDRDVHRMYDLSYCLHPADGLALSVTLEACERVTLLRRVQDRCTGHSRPRLPESCLPQYCVYLASDARERAQERPRPGQSLRQRPTPDDWLVRYIKALVWWTMDRPACHVAVALGCFLYSYQPDDIARLAPHLFRHHHARQIKRRLADQIQARFQHAHLIAGEDHVLCTRPPTDHERQLVYHALAMFTPWGCPHVPTLASGQSMLSTYFDEVPARSDWERIHALIDPTCAGLARLIREYNESLPGGSDARLADPEDALMIPCFERFASPVLVVGRACG